MTQDLLSGLLAFAFVSSITPGPNNMMLLASGANFGFRRTVPHMLGISIGHSVMVILVGAGLIAVFDRVPAIHTAMKIASLAYLAWLAWKIAQAAPDLDGTPTGARPFSFLQAAAFQWVNPKAWFMAVTAITVYSADQSLPAIVTVAAIFALTNFPSILVWVLLGREMRRFLTNPARLRAFNWTMAALLMASAIPVMLHG